MSLSAEHPDPGRPLSRTIPYFSGPNMTDSLTDVPAPGPNDITAGDVVPPYFFSGTRPTSPEAGRSRDASRPFASHDPTVSSSSSSTTSSSISQSSTISQHSTTALITPSQPPSTPRGFLSTTTTSKLTTESSNTFATTSSPSSLSQQLPPRVSSSALGAPAIKLLRDIRNVFQAVSRPMIAEERSRLRFLPLVQSLFTLYTMGLVAWRVAVFTTTSTSTDNPPLLFISLVLSCLSTIGMLFGLVGPGLVYLFEACRGESARNAKPTHGKQQDAPDSSRQHPPEELVTDFNSPDTVVPAADSSTLKQKLGDKPSPISHALSSAAATSVQERRQLVERRQVLLHALSVCNFLTSTSFALLRLACSFSSFTGSYFVNHTVLYLMDIPWVLYMSYGIVLGDRTFSTAFIILNNLDLYHNSLGLTNIPGFRAAQSFMVVSTIYHDPIYNLVLGGGTDLSQRALGIAMLTSNVAIRATISPDAFRTTASINAVFLTIAAVLLISLNPLPLIPVYPQAIFRTLSTPFKSLYAALRSALAVLRCCRPGPQALRPSRSTSAPAAALHNHDHHRPGTSGNEQEADFVSTTTIVNGPNGSRRIRSARVRVAPASGSTSPSSPDPTHSAVVPTALRGEGRTMTGMTPSDLDAALHRLVSTQDNLHKSINGRAANPCTSVLIQDYPLVKFEMDRMQALFQSCQKNGSHAFPTLLEFVSFLNALSVAAEESAAVAGFAGGDAGQMDLEAFAQVHALFLRHMLAGTAPDDFFEVDLY